MTMHISNTKRLALALFMACLPIFSLTLAQSAKMPEGITKVASVEGITEYRLESNGLKVLLFPDQSKPTITVNVTYLVGSRHEGYGETGMAHLLEHLVFKGTPKHPNIPQELTEHGARPNGSTWYDRTNYFETFSATEENLRWALDLEADRMVNSFIAKKDLDSEMTVVRNEFESGENSPSRVLFERVLSSAYLWHNYGKSTIGSRADIENVPIERLQAFYRRFYQPDNAVLLVAGKIDEAKTLDMIKQYFGAIPKPERQLVTTYTAEPTQDGERRVELRRVGDLQVAASAYHIAPGSHPDFASIEVLGEVLTSEPAGRLYKALVETKKASYVSGWIAPLKEPGFAFFAIDVLKEKSLDEATDIMLSTLDGLKDNPPTNEEVERARARLLKNFELGLKNSESVGLEMSEYIAMGDWRLAFLYRDNLEKVTAADVARVAATYFKPSNRTVGFFRPEEKPDRVEVPQAPNVEELVANYKGKAAISQGEAFDPSPANIDSRTTTGEAPGKTIEYALLPKETRGDAVTARLTLRFGDKESLKGKAMASQFAAALLERGTTKMSRQQIQDKLDALKARVRISGAGAMTSVSIDAERDKLPEVIDMVVEMLRSPAFSAEEFDKLKEERLAGLEEQRSEPMVIASREFSRSLSPYPAGDVRYTMTFDEELAALKALTLDEVKKFYKDFYGASDATISVVGDFDKGAIEKAVREKIGDWKSPKPYQRLKSEKFMVKGGEKVVNTPDKANAMFIAGHSIAMRDDNPDYPAMILANYMLGGGFLNSRLATRIRQKEGISYSVGSGFSASPYDEDGTFTTFAIYAPENAARLQQAFREEIEKVQKEGFNEEEIKAAKSGYLQSRQVSRSQDASLAISLNNMLQLDRQMDWDAQLEKKIEALTPAQINAAIKKYVDLNKMVFVKAGDFEKVAKETKP